MRRGEKGDEKVLFVQSDVDTVCFTMDMNNILTYYSEGHLNVPNNLIEPMICGLGILSHCLIERDITNSVFV